MGIMVPNSLLGTSTLSGYLIFDISLSKEVGIPQKARKPLPREGFTSLGLRVPSSSSMFRELSSDPSEAELIKKSSCPFPSP